MQRLEDVVGDRGAEQAADRPGDPPVGADERDRDAPAATGCLERGDRAIVDDVYRKFKRPSDD